MGMTLQYEGPGPISKWNNKNLQKYHHTRDTLTPEKFCKSLDPRKRSIGDGDIKQIFARSKKPRHGFDEQK